LDKTISVEISEKPMTESSLANVLFAPSHPKDAVDVYWLGQAGFAIRGGGLVLLIDPYLSDSLASKYLGSEFPHQRMMPTPLDPHIAQGVDVILCTHRHSDHMDPGTLSVVAKASPTCIFIVPRAEKDHALSIGVPGEQLLTLDAGETLPIANRMQVDAIASAHETLARNDKGEFFNLGYVLSLGGIRMYHSGDCIPYDGLAETLQAHAIDVAFLPVNGRSQRLSSRGILGNFFPEEAVSLCKSASIHVIFCHHWGMFEFNTIDPQELARRIKQLGSDVRCIIPSTGMRYRLKKA
jgi:L-ascorbate metabolism protein UlaG (beta-lactamase superfamily)